jgi:hypothetical protein
MLKYAAGTSVNNPALKTLDGVEFAITLQCAYRLPHAEPTDRTVQAIFAKLLETPTYSLFFRLAGLESDFSPHAIPTHPRERAGHFSPNNGILRYSLFLPAALAKTALFVFRYFSMVFIPSQEVETRLAFGAPSL